MRRKKGIHLTENEKEDDLERDLHLEMGLINSQVLWKLSG